MVTTAVAAHATALATAPKAPQLKIAIQAFKLLPIADVAYVHTRIYVYVSVCIYV